MNKTDLINSIAQKSGLSKKNSEAALNAFISTVEEALQNGEKVVLVGFGTFEVKLRKGRSKARNPKTGEIVSVSDHGVATFRPGRELKKAAWEMDTTRIPKSFRKRD